MWRRKKAFQGKIQEDGKCLFIIAQLLAAKWGLCGGERENFKEKIHKNRTCLFIVQTKIIKLSVKREAWCLIDNEEDKDEKNMKGKCSITKSKMFVW